MSWMRIQPNILPVFIDYMLDEGVPELPPDLPWPRGYTLEEAESFTEETMKTLQSSLEKVNLLDPYLIRSEASFHNLKEKLTAEVDFLLPIQVGHEYRAGWRDTMSVIVKLGEFGKPLICVPLSVWGFDHALQPVSILRATGREVYFAADIDDLNRLLNILRAKKALSKSKVILFSNHPIITTGTIYDPSVAKKIIGLDLEYYDRQRINQIFKTIPMSEAEKVADTWIKDATEIHHLYREDEVDRKNFVEQAKIYLTLKKLVEEEDVDGFAGCRPVDQSHFDAPACFSYIKLKDEGIPCICEADLNAGFAMMMLMYLSEKPADMGNVLTPTGKPDMEDFKVPNPEKDTLIITHSVTPLKPDGFETSQNPYQICGTHCDTCWAVNAYTELRPGQDVTIARLSWQGDKMLIAEGKVVCTKLTPAQGNRECVYIKVPDRLKLFHALASYGNHLTFVYGRYGEELGELCKILGVQPEYV
ncbi:MAG: hypothetical protein NWF14_03730 [Candidatus Bathyarchaeota archaeon]|nr:hypothetical protein [Candidatus Bathyarchaeota archaeon]